MRRISKNSRLRLGEDLTRPWSFKVVLWAWLLALVATTCTASLPCRAGELTARQILNRAAQVFEAVNDYVVDAKLTIDSPDIHVSETKVRIFFKKPNKIHVESDDGFAILPRQGIVVGNPLREVVNHAEISLAGEETVNGVKCRVIKAAYQKEGRGIESTLWIDPRRSLVLQIKGNPEWGPSIKVRLWYTKVAGKYWLPSRSHATVLIPPLPRSRVDKDFANQRPTIIDMRFIRYRVNLGLSDKIFEEDNEKT